MIILFILCILFNYIKRDMLKQHSNLITVPFYNIIHDPIKRHRYIGPFPNNISCKNILSDVRPPYVPNCFQVNNTARMVKTYYFFAIFWFLSPTTAWIRDLSEYRLLTNIYLIGCYLKRKRKTTKS
jgi:hypothetical protein